MAETRTAGQTHPAHSSQRVRWPERSSSVIPARYSDLTSTCEPECITLLTCWCDPSAKAECRQTSCRRFLFIAGWRNRVCAAFCHLSCSWPTDACTTVAVGVGPRLGSATGSAELGKQGGNTREYKFRSLAGAGPLITALIVFGGRMSYRVLRPRYVFFYCGVHSEAPVRSSTSALIPCLSVACSASTVGWVRGGVPVSRSESTQSK